MKLKKLLKKVEVFLDSDARSRKEKKSYVKRVLKKLRKYEHEIGLQLQDETDEEIKEQLQKRIALSHAQRKKGVKLLHELKKTNMA